MASRQEVIARATETGLRSRKGLALSPQSFGQMMRNTIYMGKVESPDFGVSTKGNFEPLVDEATFYRAQAVLDGRVVVAGPRQRNHPDFPLRGFVRCESAAVRSRARHPVHSAYRHEPPGKPRLAVAVGLFKLTPPSCRGALRNKGARGALRPPRRFRNAHANPAQRVVGPDPNEVDQALAGRQQSRIVKEPPEPRHVGIRRKMAQGPCAFRAFLDVVRFDGHDRPALERLVRRHARVNPSGCRDVVAHVTWRHLRCVAVIL